MAKKCPRCGARWKEDPSCGKVIHLELPSKAEKLKGETKKSMKKRDERQQGLDPSITGVPAGKVWVYVPENVSHAVQMHEVEVRINAGDDPQKVLALIDYMLAAYQGPYEGDRPLSAPGCDRQYEISEDVWAVTGDPGEGHYGVVVSPTGNDRLAEEKAREILAKWPTPRRK
jgi:hypothetical protein